MDLFECLVTVFKWIKHEKEENKTKLENLGKFHKPAKIFAGVAKFRNPYEKIDAGAAKFRKAPASEILLNFNWP